MAGPSRIRETRDPYRTVLVREGGRLGPTTRASTSAATLPEHAKKRPGSFDSLGTHPRWAGSNFGRSLSLTTLAGIWHSADPMGLRAILDDRGSGSGPAVQACGKPPARTGDAHPLGRKASSGRAPSTRALQSSYEGHAALISDVRPPLASLCSTLDNKNCSRKK